MPLFSTVDLVALAWFIAEYRVILSRISPGAHVALLVMRNGRLAYVALESAAKNGE